MADNTPPPRQPAHVPAMVSPMPIISPTAEPDTQELQNLCLAMMPSGNTVRHAPPVPDPAAAAEAARAATPPSTYNYQHDYARARGSIGNLRGQRPSVPDADVERHKSNAAAERASRPVVAAEAARERADRQRGVAKYEYMYPMGSASNARELAVVSSLGPTRIREHGDDVRKAIEASAQEADKPEVAAAAEAKFKEHTTHFWAASKAARKRVGPPPRMYPLTGCRDSGAGWEAKLRLSFNTESFGSPLTNTTGPKARLKVLMTDLTDAETDDAALDLISKIMGLADDVTPLLNSTSITKEGLELIRSSIDPQGSKFSTNAKKAECAAHVVELWRKRGGEGDVRAAS